MNLIKRLSTLVKRKSNANRYGIKITRAADWHIPDRLFSSGHSFPIKSPHDIGSDNAFLDIFLDDCYPLKNFKPTHIKTVLDIGGHIGLFGSYARTVFPNAKIHAYEANPDMHELIEHQSFNFKFEYFKEAVGLTDGKISLVKDKDSVNTTSYNDSHGSITKTFVLQSCCKT